MLEGIEGHGRSGVSHRRHMFTEDVPRSILIVDYEERIAGFIEANHDVLDRAVVLVETVTAFQA
jgi:PII-like signaling protein